MLFTKCDAYQKSFMEVVFLVQVKTWAKLLKEFCTTEELQLELLYNVLVECYKATKLMKLFPEIVRILKEEDVLDEDTILLWFREGTNPKERYVAQLSSSLHIFFAIFFFGIVIRKKIE